MTEQNKWISDEINQSILQNFHEAINQHIGRLYNSQRAQQVDQAIHLAQANFEKQHASWVKDEPSKFHLQFMSLILAGYRTLSEFMTREDALALVKTAVIEPNRKDMLEGVKYALDYAPDPMVVIVDASREREEFFFGKTFIFERNQDDQQAYILHVKQCFYHQFAMTNDAPELMQILCEWDWLWANAIEPVRHNFSFELPTTLGYGGDMCRFCFRRLTK
jgi:hypothetical protein